jgi:hypothetical protein
MRVEGRRHRGAIAYSAEADRADVTLCYCADRQRLSGSPYRLSVTVRAVNFVLSAGEPKIHVKTAENGARREEAFCRDCGAIHSSRAEADPRTHTLRVSALAQRAQSPPRLQQSMRSKARLARTDRRDPKLREGLRQSGDDLPFERRRR